MGDPIPQGRGGEAAAQAEREERVLRLRADHEIGNLLGEEGPFLELELAYAGRFFGATPPAPDDWQAFERTARAVAATRHRHIEAKADLYAGLSEHPLAIGDGTRAERVVTTFRQLRTLEGRLEDLTGVALLPPEAARPGAGGVRREQVFATPEEPPSRAPGLGVPPPTPEAERPEPGGARRGPLAGPPPEGAGLAPGRGGRLLTPDAERQLAVALREGLAQVEGREQAAALAADETVSPASTPPLPEAGEVREAELVPAPAAGALEPEGRMGLVAEAAPARAAGTLEPEGRRGLEAEAALAPAPGEVEPQGRMGPEAEGAGLAGVLAPAAAGERLDELVAAYEACRRAYHEEGGEGAGGRREALVAMTEAELELQGFEFDRRREYQVVVFEHDRAAAALAQAEAAAGREPGAAQLESYERLALRVSGLEAQREALEPRLAALESGRLGREAARLEARLTTDPVAEDLIEYTRLVERRLGLEHAYGAGGRRGEGRGARLEGLFGGMVKDPGAARRAFDLAAAALQAKPSRETLRETGRAIADHHAARVAELGRDLMTRLRRSERELWATAGEIERARSLPGGVAPGLAARWRHTLGRYQVAQTNAALAMRPPRAAGEGALARLEVPLARLRRGDLTPENLARLHREAALAVRAATGRMPPPAPALQPAGRELGEAVAELGRRHVELLRAVREAGWQRAPGREGQAPGAAFERLRVAAAGYQGAAATVQRLGAEADLLAVRRVLPARAFVEHPRFAGAPERAIAAWAAHSMRQGVAPRTASESLTRGAGFRLGTPRAYSARFTRMAAQVVMQWIMRLARERTQELRLEI